MSLALYDIDSELRVLLENAQEFTEDTPPEEVDEWLANFEEIKGNRGKKLESIVHVRNQAVYHKTSIQLEIDRLSFLMKRENALADKMERLLVTTMRNANESEVKTDLFKAKFVKNPAKMILAPEFEDSIKDKYKVPGLAIALKDANAKVSEYKKELKVSLKAGQFIDGAKLEHSERLKIE